VTARREVLRALAAAPAAAGALVAREAAGKEYASAAEVLAEVARLEADVDARLFAVARAVPGARAFAESVRRDHERHAAQRAAIASRLAVAVPVAAPPPLAPERGLEPLRQAQQDLVHAFAEGLPVFDDAAAIHVLAAQMVDAARHLTVLDLWVELEEQRAG
jgi:hypothetical protein